MKLGQGGGPREIERAGQTVHAQHGFHFRGGLALVDGEGIVDDPRLAEEFHIHPQAVHIHHHGAEAAEIDGMGGVPGEVEEAALPRVSADHIDCAAIGADAAGGFAIGRLLAQAGIQDHARGEAAGETVVPVEQAGAFIDVAVTAEHEVHPVAFQDRHRVLAHLDEIGAEVGVVRAEGVGRLVPEGDDPILLRGHQVLLQPGEHGRAGRAIRGRRIQADEMDVRVVEGVVTLVAGGDAARLAVAREVEDFEVGKLFHFTVGIDVVVADGGPGHGLPQQLRVGIEDAALILAIRAGVIGVVAQHEPQVGAARRMVGVFQKLLVAVAHVILDLAAGPEIADDPEPHRPRLGGRSDEVMIRAPRQDEVLQAHFVKVFRVRQQAGEPHGVLGLGRGIGQGEIQRCGIGAVAHDGIDIPIRAPADHEAGGGAGLQVGTAQQVDGRRLTQLHMRDRRIGGVTVVVQRARLDREAARAGSLPDHFVRGHQVAADQVVVGKKMDRMNVTIQVGCRGVKHQRQRGLLLAVDGGEQRDRGRSQGQPGQQLEIKAGVIPSVRRLVQLHGHDVGAGHHGQRGALDELQFLRALHRAGGRGGRGDGSGGHPQPRHLLAIDVDDRAVIAQRAQGVGEEKIGVREHEGVAKISGDGLQGRAQVHHRGLVAIAPAELGRAGSPAQIVEAPLRPARVLRVRHRAWIVTRIEIPPDRSPGHQRGNGWQRAGSHREHRRRAAHHAGLVGHDHLVATRAGSLHVDQREAGVLVFGEVGTVELPPVTQRLRA